MRAVEGAEVVVHLVAIRQGSDDQFRRVMEQATRDLVAVATPVGVRRIVLMSALGTSEETRDLVPYYRAKWEMEQTVAASGSSTSSSGRASSSGATAGSFRRSRSSRGWRR